MLALCVHAHAHGFVRVVNVLVVFVAIINELLSNLRFLKSLLKCYKQPDRGAYRVAPQLKMLFGGLPSLEVNCWLLIYQLRWYFFFCIFNCKNPCMIVIMPVK